MKIHIHNFLWLKIFYSFKMEMFCYPFKCGWITNVMLFRCKFQKLTVWLNALKTFLETHFVKNHDNRLWCLNPIDESVFYQFLKLFELISEIDLLKTIANSNSFYQWRRLSVELWAALPQNNSFKIFDKGFENSLNF